MTGQTTRVRRRQPAPAQAAAVEAGLHFGPTAAYAPLASAQVRRLIDAALSLLEDVGVGFPAGSEACALFAAAGCTVADDGVVRIPRSVVEASLGSVARETRLWDRDGINHITLDDRHTWFFPGMTCINVYDRESGEVRPSTAADLAMITRLADALPNIDGVCIACKDVEHSDIVGEVGEFAVMARNTRKPLEYLCEHAESLATVIELAAAIRGGRQALQDKPYFLQIITPLPVNYADTHADQLILAARSGVPVSVGTLPIGGASSPITPAGCIAQSLATDFAGMTLAQLAAPGSFVIGSSDVCFMEPSTGAIGNFTQTALADMVMCQVRRELGLPSFTGVAGYSSARRFDEDAVWELSSTLMQAFYSRPATCDYLGSLDGGMIYSMAALVFCDDLVGMLRSLWEGMALDDDALAVTQAREVGPRGNYLALRHTVSHCREHLWQSRYFGAKLPTTSNDLKDQVLHERIEADLRQILATHRVPELPAAIEAELAAILRRFAAAHAAA